MVPCVLICFALWSLDRTLHVTGVILNVEALAYGGESGSHPLRLAQNFVVALDVVLTFFLAPTAFIGVMERCSFGRAFTQTLNLYDRCARASLAFMIPFALLGGIFLLGVELAIPSMGFAWEAIWIYQEIFRAGFVLVISFIAVPAMVTILKETREEWATDQPFQFSVGVMMVGSIVTCLLAVIAW